jgi:hypothetical protein
MLWICSKWRRRGQKLPGGNQFNGKVVGGPIHRNGENLKFMTHGGAPTTRLPSWRRGVGGALLFWRLVEVGKRWRWRSLLLDVDTAMAEGKTCAQLDPVKGRGAETRWV